MKKRLRVWVSGMLAFFLLLPSAFAAAKITSSDAYDVVQGAGTRNQPWVLTVGNTYTILTGKVLGSNDCLDANWYVTGDSAKYIEIVGQNYNTVNPRIKAIAASGDTKVTLTLKHQTYEPGVDLNVWTAVDNYIFTIQEADSTNENSSSGTGSSDSSSDIITIKFYANGGSGSMGSQSIPSGGTFTLPECGFTAPAGKQFKAWRLNGVEFLPGKTVQFVDKPSTAVFTALWEDAPSSSSDSSSSSSSDSSSKSGSCGPDVTWSLEADELVIRGTGVMDLEYTEAPWYAYRNMIQTVTIHPGVTSIDTAAFRDCEKLENIIIPDTVSIVSADAFQRCYALEYLTLPDGLTRIASSTFSNCTNLKSLNVPDGTEKVEMYAFQKCSSLESVRLPTSLKRIESTAFVGCTALADVYYDGTKAQWAEVFVGSENDPLLNATLHTSDFVGKYESSAEETSLPSDSSLESSSSKPSGESSTLSGLHSGAWYEDTMEWAQKNGITKDADYSTPNADCTRAAMVLYMWRANGCPSAEKTSSFIDVSSNTDYYDAVLWAVDKGIVMGFEDGSFRPLDTVTRAQMVTLLHRQSGAGKVSSKTSFSDVPAGAWYEESVQWAVENSITNGISNSIFAPDNNCTIAQALTFMQRLYSMDNSAL